MEPIIDARRSVSLPIYRGHSAGQRPCTRVLSSAKEGDNKSLSYLLDTEKPTHTLPCQSFTNKRVSLSSEQLIFRSTASSSNLNSGGRRLWLRRTPVIHGKKYSFAISSTS